LLKNFRNIVQEICREAGWDGSASAGSDCFGLALEGGLSLTVRALTRDLTLFWLPLAAQPDSEAETDRQCRRLGQLAAAAFGQRRSILSVKDGFFGLHLIVDSAVTRVSETPALCRDFLNDGQWWRQKAAEVPVRSGPEGLEGLGGPAGLGDYFGGGFR
jgi:hypothetical protein